MAVKEKLMSALNNAPEEFRRYHILMEYAQAHLSVEDAANAIGIKLSTFGTYISQVQKTGYVPGDKKGPKERHKGEAHAERMVELRKKNLKSEEITEILNETENVDISPRTVTRVLRERGFKKLRRRSKKERERAKILIEREKDSYPNRCKSDIECHKGDIVSENAGVFLFVPFITELKLQEMVDNIYGTRDISALNYFFTYLALKLVGAKRYSRVEDYEHDRGLGLFTGLDKLPSVAKLHTYHYGLTKEDNKNLRVAYGKTIKERIDGKFFNLDFKSIQFFGESDEFENNYVSSQRMAMKSSLAFLAQDQESTIFCYSDGDVKRKEMNDKVLEFVSYWEEVSGKKPECLVFDSKVTTYPNLWKLDKEEHVKFITLRRRGKNLVAGVDDIPKEDWKRVHLKNVKRKYRNLKVADRNTTLDIKDENGKIINKLGVRELVITNNGRDEPTFMITTDEESSIKDVIEGYAPRWRIENGIEEEVDFFNLNALPSTLGVKRDFDVIMTQIASGLYKMLGKQIWGFGKAKPTKIYEKIVKGGRDIEISDDKILVKLTKKKYTPLLRDAEFMKKEIRAEWLGNRKIEFEFI